VTDISEFSLTRTAENLECVVLERWVPTAVETSHDEMIIRLKRVRELVEAYAKAA